MTSDPHTQSGNDRPRSSGSCILASVTIAVVWGLVVMVHGYTTWPHIPMDVSASDPVTLASFNAVVQRHIISHAIAGLAPFVMAIAFIRYVCGKRR